ncbi:MAG TPA: hypothetical protein VFF82_12590 [Rhodocyclaceae bacterium]|nr:hypothetical protein [Rhodocyclaceae bacterium]
MRCRHLHPFLVLSLVAVLGGCELLGQEDPAKLAAAKEADGKAIGGACRHSGRALEDCYVMNPKAMKSAIYTGWRDMDGYMRENNINAVMPDLVDAPAGGKGEGAAATARNPESDKKPADANKSGVKHSAAQIAPQAAKPRRFT